MTNNPLLLILLLACLLGFAGCKDSKEGVHEKNGCRLQSYMVESCTQGYGGAKESVSVVLQYDEQNRLLAFNNDSIAWKYVYRADGAVDVSGKYLKDGTEQFSGTTTLNSAGLPETDDYLFVKMAFPEIPLPFSDKMKYTYNEKGRLATAREVVGAGDYSYTIDLAFTYDDGGNNVIRMDYGLEVFGKKKVRHYEFEYLDTDNVLDFYPEITMIAPMNAGFQVMGKNGYRRDKLLKQINLSDDNNVLVGVITCGYQYDADGKMTEMKMTMQRMDSDGEPMGEEEFIRYYDMKF